MEICNCGTPSIEHYTSWHYAQKRNAIMLTSKEFMDRIYPADIFGQTFDRKQVELLIACFILDNDPDGGLGVFHSGD